MPGSFGWKKMDGVAGVMESSTHWIMHASNSESRGAMMIDAPVLSQEGCRKTARMKRNEMSLEQI